MPFAALLLAVAPMMSDELVWRTMPPATPSVASPRAVSIAVDGDGFIAAWEEGGKVYAGALDARGRPTGAMRAIGAGFGPSIAPAGGRFLAVWFDPTNSAGTVLLTAALDRNLNVLDTHLVPLRASPPVLRPPFVASGSMLYELDVDGAPVKVVLEASKPIDDFVWSPEVAYVSHTTTRSPTMCGFAGCFPPFDTYALSFTWLNRATNGWSWRFTGDSPATICANGDAFLIVYLSSTLGARAIAIRGAEVREIALPGPLPRYDAAAQAQVAWDGARWVVVWPVFAGIIGVTIDPDLIVTPFAVNDRGTRPALAVSSPGRLLLTYEVVDPQSRRFASRIIDFNPPARRERAVR